MVAQSSDFVDVSDSLSGAERQPLLIILEALHLRSLSYVVGRMVAERSDFSDFSDFQKAKQPAWLLRGRIFRILRIFRKESSPHGC